MNLIIYSSKTGNTKLVCNEVFLRSKVFNKIISIDELSNTNLDDYQNILIGYWNYMGKCDPKTENLLTNILKNKNLFLLGTLGAYDNSKHCETMKERVKTFALLHNNVIGEFACRGKIDMSIDMIKAHQNYTEEDRIRKESSLLHPNEEDFKNATNEVLKVFSVWT